MHSFTGQFGINIPILQAPTGSVAGPELAVAVSEAGGMGALGLTWTPPALAAEAVRQTRARTNKPFLVNFALAFPPQSLLAALEAGAPVVTFSWGNPAEWLPLVRSFGAKVGVQVATVDGARHAAALGVDFLICQGSEAGGHVQSTTPLERLLGAALASVSGSLPVLAAGGITDAADINRLLARGADGVMLGTRFVATQESRAHAAYKARLVAAASEESVLTICFEGGWQFAPHRVLRNRTLDAWETAGCPPPGRRPGEGEPVGWSASGEPILRYEDTAPRVGMTGDLEAMALYAGNGVGRITDLPSAGELLRRLWADVTVGKNLPQKPETAPYTA
jgi:NAD(P)H-dependent flavin oxidoreductase YrpB (nitropropane dioxygenase family)